MAYRYCLPVNCLRLYLVSKMVVLSRASMAYYYFLPGNYGVSASTMMAHYNCQTHRGAKMCLADALTLLRCPKMPQNLSCSYPIPASPTKP